MKKHITIEIEICDVCQENEINRYYHHGPVTCNWCGKVLCNKCAESFDGFTMCIVCKKEKLQIYNRIENKMKMLDKEYEEAREELELETRRINEMKRVEK